MSKTHVVHEHGKFPTVSAAIKAADRDDRIVVRPGRYEESLVVDKPLEIIGDGPRASIEIWGAADTNVLTFEAAYGRIAGLTFRQHEAENQRRAVSIRLGRLDLEDCDISSDSASCIFILHGADPRLRRNVIHNGKHYGVFVYEGGRGTMEDNEIFGCQWANVCVQEGSTPAFRRNVIRDSGRSGVRVLDTGLGLFEENVITGNGHSGVVIEAHGYPTLRGNRINLNADYGVRVFEKGAGVVEDNDLTGNGQGAWHLEEGATSNVVQARNRG